MPIGVRPRPSVGHAGCAEVPRTLAERAPRAPGVLDQLGLWGNLRVSLLGFTGALVVLQPGGPDTPRRSLAAALLAVVVGTALGAAAVAVPALPGAQTGAPASASLLSVVVVVVAAAATALLARAARLTGSRP